jgi:hypothetical protein
MPANFDGSLADRILGPLVILQRSLHREVNGYSLITAAGYCRNAFRDILPGVLLHEGSHYLTDYRWSQDRFSIIPVHWTGAVFSWGMWRPLVRIGSLMHSSNGALIASGLLYLHRCEPLNLPRWWVWTGGWTLSELINALVARPDFWLWIYLALW